MTTEPAAGDDMTLPDSLFDEPVDRLEDLITWLGEGPGGQGLSRRQVRNLRDQLAGILHDLRRERGARPAADDTAMAQLAAARLGVTKDEPGAEPHTPAGTGRGEQESSGETWQGECGQAEGLESLAAAERIERVYNLFLEYFGGFDRQLSGHEANQLRIWLEECPHALVYLAILKAVNRGRINLRYVDRILFNWSKAGVRTVADARERDAAFMARRGGSGGERGGGSAGKDSSGRLGQHPGEAGRDYDDAELW